MSLLVKDFYNFLENIAPLQIAEHQDNNGLQIGSLFNTVSGVLLTIDVSNDVISYALEKNLNLIISHHPLIYKPITNIVKDDLKGNLIYSFIKYDLNLISWHTPLDKISDGVSEAFIKALNLESFDFILKEKNEKFGLGRVVYLKKSIKLQDLAKRIGNLINSWVMVVGDLETLIDSFGFCGGSGAFLKDELKKLKINTLITSDVKYHIAMEAYEEGFNFIIIDHGISESFILPFLKNKIQEFLKNYINIPIEIFQNKSPYKILIYKEEVE
ncbi:MAG: Nif3-like dinuclear metal center hexameric protein [Thermodesulfobacteriota bacterium]|nr:MAG: Nif3-like dinuclear metal center hexameric protein [Thermodesulfobacteriota bacterium]